MSDLKTLALAAKENNSEWYIAEELRTKVTRIITDDVGYIAAASPDAILKLSDIMEYVIYDCKSEKVPLTKELKFISSYIDLEKLRYDKEETIQLKIDVNSEGYEISPLLLIQFIENAFKHGMEQAKAGSFLNMEIKLADGWLYYTSENSINNREYSKGGVGLENVRKRLEMLYEGRHSLDINQTESTYQVKLAIHL